MVQFSAGFVSILLSFGLIETINTFRVNTKKATKRLHTSEKRYRLHAENVKDVIWIPDLRSMKLVYITPSIENMMGYTPEEAQNFSFREMLPPEAEKKALESKLHQSGKLEAIGTLAGGIAHDMNNIIAAILGNADLSLHDAVQHTRMHHRLMLPAKGSGQPDSDFQPTGHCCPDQAGSIFKKTEPHIID